MNYYSETDSHIKDYSKVLLLLLNYVTKKDLKYATGFDTSNLAAKREFTALKTETDKLDIDELVNIPNDMKYSKTKVNDLDVDKPKNVLVYLKKFSDVIVNDVKKTE